MASGDLVLDVIQANPPGTSYASVDIRVGGSTPPENILIWKFDADSNEYLDFTCRMSPDYSGEGLTLTIAWSASSATSGNCIWRAAIRTMPDDAEDIDASHSYSFKTATVAAPSSSGEVAYDDIVFTDGSEMDNLTAGQMFVLRVGREADGIGDTMTGDAELWGIFGKES